MYQPLISIILSAYNAEKYIERAINSIINQTYPKIELIIADDGSTDHTKALINSFSKHPKVLISHNDTNQGKIHTCNRLLKKCKGEIINIHDADDWSETNRFEVAIKYFNENKNISLYGSFSRYIKVKDNTIQKIRKYDGDINKLKEAIRKQNVFDGGTMIFKREVYDTLGGYNSFYNHSGGEDYDWLIRVTEHFEVGIIPEILYNYSLTPHSFSRGTDSAEKLFCHEIIHFCKEQREKGEIDAISEGGDMKILEHYIEQLFIPYKEDSSLVYRKNMEISMYHKLYHKALYCSWMAIKSSPMKFVNYRALLYVIRKSNLKLLV